MTDSNGVFTETDITSQDIFTHQSNLQNHVKNSVCIQKKFFGSSNFSAYLQLKPNLFS